MQRSRAEKALSHTLWAPTSPGHITAVANKEVGTPRALRHAKATGVHRPSVHFRMRKLHKVVGNHPRGLETYSSLRDNTPSSQVRLKGLSYASGVRCHAGSKQQLRRNHDGIMN
ncbi:hypothetical protein Ddc_09621 [Ditylenchus destructor]|nr:hypothetical protein Ddc_09621 [Ditylenchus destructor]